MVTSTFSELNFEFVSTLLLCALSLSLAISTFLFGGGCAHYTMWIARPLF